jgi:hypothetical protein
MEYNPPEMTIAQMDELLAFLPSFTPENYEPGGVPQPYNFFQTLQYNRRVVRNFCNMCTVVCKDIHPYNLLPEDGLDSEDGVGLFLRFGTIEAMQTASANQIRRLFMFCNRGNQFGVASIEDLLTTGVITAALHRLQVLRIAIRPFEDDPIPADDADFNTFFRLDKSDPAEIQLLNELFASVGMHSISNAPFVFLVGRVKWDGPHEPSMYFTPFCSWQKQPTPAMLADARQNALRDQRFFRVCTICKRFKNIGHMYKSNTCQSCASRYMGVVY